MNRIRLLPEQVANQIAAGEVVERPASVVKELVENALDAQAGRVTVEIQGGGRSLIRVTDDGLGMSKDDAPLCLERHATSKMQVAEDLAALRERLRALVGADLRLLPVDFSADIAAPDGPWEDLQPASPGLQQPLRVWGFVGAPGVSRATRQDQHLFVNRRPVENRALNYALLEGYHTALMKGRYPVCCLFLELDPAEVDVNIHPAKREVRFHQEKGVRQRVAEAVRRTLLNFHATRGEAQVERPEPNLESAPAPAALPAPPSRSIG